MLPFFLISNTGETVSPAARNFLQLSDSDINNLLFFNNNGFSVAILPAPDNHYFNKGNEFVIVCGFIRHPNFIWDWKDPNQSFFQQLLTDLAIKTPEQIKEIYTGNFTILYLADNNLKVFNTLSGLQPVYYHSQNGITTISSHIICLQSIVNEPVYNAGALQMTLNEWSETYTRATILKKVSRMVCNEHIVFKATGDFQRRIMPFNIQYKADTVPVMECVASVWEGYKNIGKQFAGKNLEACMSLSGGVDSRTCLTAIYKHAKMDAINHGGKDYYESLRAKDVGDAFNVPVHIANSSGVMFLPKERLVKYFLHDGGVVIEYDPLKESAKKNNLPPILVLGDLFETFKVDGTSIWDGRAKLMIGGNIPFQTIADFGFEK